MEYKPETAREIVLSLPERFRPEIAEYDETIVHLDISGERGGAFTVKIEDGKCEVQEGLQGEPECTVKTSDRVYEDLELGRTNPQMAVMMGKVKVSNIPVLLKFIQMFRRLS